MTPCVTSAMPYHALWIPTLPYTPSSALSTVKCLREGKVNQYAAELDFQSSWFKVQAGVGIYSEFMEIYDSSLFYFEFLVFVNFVGHVSPPLWVCCHHALVRQTLDRKLHCVCDCVCVCVCM